MPFTETEWRDRVRQIVEKELSRNSVAHVAFATERKLMIKHNGVEIPRDPADVAGDLLGLTPQQFARACREVHFELCGRPDTKQALAVVDVVLFTAIPVLWLKSEKDLKEKGVSKEFFEGIEVMTIGHHLAYASEIVCAYLDRRPARFRKPEVSQDGVGADFRGGPSIVLAESGADLSTRFREIDVVREIAHLLDGEIWGWRRNPTQMVQEAWRADQGGVKWKNFVERLTGLLELLIAGDVGARPLKPYVLLSTTEEIDVLRSATPDMIRILKLLRVVKLREKLDDDPRDDAVGAQLSSLLTHPCRE